MIAGLKTMMELGYYATRTRFTRARIVTRSSEYDGTRTQSTVMSYS